MLIKQQEFISNKLIRTQTSSYSWEEERRKSKDRQLERWYQSGLKDFKNVIKSAIDKEKQYLQGCANNASTAFRFSKRKQSWNLFSPEGRAPPQHKAREMEARTSTPLIYRNSSNIVLDNSDSGIEDGGIPVLQMISQVDILVKIWAWELNWNMVWLHG